MTADYKTDIVPVSDDRAEGQARELLDGARAKLGFVPNMYRGMAVDPGLLSTYLHGYAQFRESEIFTPPEQEVVFLEISRANGCDYCVAAHSMLAVKMSGLSEAQTGALREGRPLEDARLEALRSFTHHMWATRGLPGKPEADAFKAAGFADRHVLEIILAISVKTLSNYANHVNHTELDEVFAEFAVDRKTETA